MKINSEDSRVISHLNPDCGCSLVLGQLYAVDDWPESVTEILEMIKGWLAGGIYRSSL